MQTLKGNRQVVLDGRGPLTLRDADYITSGGEGSIYRVNNTVVKLYADPSKMARDKMADKVALLSRLNHPSIVAPQGVVLSKKDEPLGFYMPWVEGEPLSRLFVTDFRVRTGFSDKDCLKLVARMKNAVEYAHAHKMVMVDANELNWLVQLQNKNASLDPLPYVIDVDSWATAAWPAMVIMPSIRDWHSHSFNQYSDWFAWGIVTFQAFTGIHPFKGKLDGYKPGELEKRMKANASVFTPGVRLPHSVRDFAAIPGPLLDWYQALFQNGERTVPPSPFDTTKVATAAIVLRKVTTATGSLTFEKLFSRAGDRILRVWPSGVALLSSKQLVDMESGTDMGRIHSLDAEIVKKGAGWLIADTKDGAPSFRYVEGHTSTALTLSVSISKFFRAENRLFAVSNQEMWELELQNLGRPLLTIGKRISISPNATRWFEGVAIADVLGATFLYLPLLDGKVMQTRAKELDALTPVMAKAGNRFVSIIALDRQGEYHKLEFTFDKEYQHYSLSKGRVDSPELNLAILPSGVTASVVDDGELVIFVPHNGNLKKVQDAKITTAMSLTTWKDKVVYVRDDAVWQVRSA